MLLSQLLNALDQTTGMVHQASALIAAKPALAQAAGAQLDALVKNLNAAERSLQTIASNALQRPLPAPNPEHVGGWSAQARKALKTSDPNLPETIPTVPMLQKIATSAQALIQWASGQQPAAPAGPPIQARPVQSTAIVPTNGGAQAQAPAASQPPKHSHFPAIFLGLVSIAGTAITAYAAYKHDKKKAAAFDVGLGDVTLDDVEREAQSVIDNEIPGAQVKVSKSPNGRFVASVRNGRETMAREEASDPATAAGDATRAALDLDAQRSAPLDEAELVGNVTTRRSAR